MKLQLSSIIILFLYYVAVESAKVVEVSRSRRHFDAHRAKRGIITLRDIGDEIELGDDVELVPSSTNILTTAKGVQRVRVNEVYHGMVVSGAVAEVEVSHGQMTGAMYGHLAETSSIHHDIPDPEACQRDIDDMINIAVEAEGIDINDQGISNRKGEREVYIDINNNNKAVLLYEVEFFYQTKENISHPVYGIDACNLTVLFHYNNIVTGVTTQRDARDGNSTVDSSDDDVCDAGNPTSDCPIPHISVGGNIKTGKKVYGLSPMCLDFERTGDNCTMENEFVKVVNNEGSSDRRRTYDPIVFKCEEGYVDTVNQAYGVAADAYYYGTKTFTFLQENFGIRALPHKPRMVVHMNRNFDNAFWDGTDMYFGDGYQYFYPLTCLDVTAHELAHGFTTFNSNLRYQRQSGGMNEAFSDIYGEVVQNWVTGNNDGWMIGEDIGKPTFREALRFMSNPPQDGRSIKHINNYYNGLNVHYSSGIYNYAFYQIVDVQGIPIIQAFEPFMEANMDVWGSDTGFIEGACGVVQCAYDAGFDTEKFKAGFEATGITFEDCNVTALATIIDANETRVIKTSRLRQPIFQLGDTVTEVSADGTFLEICTDELCPSNNITTTGRGSVTISPPTGPLFVRVSSNSEFDMTVNLTTVVS